MYIPTENYIVESTLKIHINNLHVSYNYNENNQYRINICRHILANKIYFARFCVYLLTYDSFLLALQLNNESTEDSS